MENGKPSATIKINLEVCPQKATTYLAVAELVFPYS